MEKASSSAVWWRGAITGALKAVPLGLAIGLGAAALLAFVAIPLVPTLAPIVGSFLTFSGAPALLTIPTTAMHFFPVPLLFFNTAITMAANFISGGDQAVAQERQQRDHSRNEARIGQLEARTQELAPAPETSRAVQAILAQGPRSSHMQAEQARSQAPSQPTLH